MKTLRIAWWLSNYQYSWWLPIAIIVLGTFFGFMIHQMEYRQNDKLLIVLDDQRTAPTKLPINTTAKIKFISNQKAHNSIDAVLTVTNTTSRLSYNDYGSKRSKLIILDVKNALELAGINSQDLITNSGMQTLGFEQGTIERLTVLCIYITSILAMTAGILKSIVLMRGAPTTEVLISGLGTTGTLNARMLELLIRTARFWLIAVIIIGIIRCISPHADLELLTIVAQTPIWLISSAIIIGIPHAILVTSMAIAIASCGGRLFIYLKNIYILFLLVATALGALLGIVTPKILEILCATNQDQAYKLLDMWNVLAATCPFTAGPFIIAEMAKTNSIPTLWSASLCITIIAAFWCYRAALLIFPTAILDTSIRCHWRKFITSMVWPFAKF